MTELAESPDQSQCILMTYNAAHAQNTQLRFTSTLGFCSFNEFNPEGKLSLPAFDEIDPDP